MKRSLLPVLLVTWLFGPSAHGQAKKLPDSVPEALTKAEKVELLSLDPEHESKGAVKDGFHGWKVLGRTELKEDDRRKVLEALEKGVPGDKGGARCFIPRHGIRVHKGKETLDLVICF